MSASKVGILNYGAGNIYSLSASLNRQGVSFGIINHAKDFALYDKVIIPGVGHAMKAMKNLEEKELTSCLINFKKPVLGICLGMQLLTDSSEEGNINLLQQIPLRTTAFPKELPIKIPHMGWNKVKAEKKSPLFQGIPINSYFYFVHSYFVEYNPKFTLASCNYGTIFSAAIQNGNFYGVQFHPEKSGVSGEMLLKNFSNQV